MGRKSGDCVSHIETETDVAAHFTIPRFFKGIYTKPDASNDGAGAVLSQGQIGKDLPIAYASRSFHKAEKNYSTVEKELAAIVWGVKHFRPYLYGRKFKIVRDYRT